MSRAPLCALGAAVLLFATGGCIIDELQSVGRPCNGEGRCGPGATCNPTTLICEAAAADGPQPDRGDGPSRDVTVDADAGPSEGPPPDVGPEGGVPPATCNNTTKLVLNEVAVGAADYIVIFNLGGVTVDLQGYTIYFAAGSKGSATEGSYSFSISRKLIPGQAAYVFEENKGAGADINTGAPLPFESKSDSTVALYDPQGNLVDYVAIGQDALLQPQGATFTPQPVTINLLFDPEKESYQRSAYAGKCPGFFRDDWLAKPITRAP